jgi:hypothetical protein
MELANAWANGSGERAAFEAALAEMIGPPPGPPKNRSMRTV